MRPLTGSCFLLLLLERLFLFPFSLLPGICLSSLWSAPFPFHALALITLSFAKVGLWLTLTVFPLMIWCSGQTALFLFFLARVALAYLPNARSVALRSPFPFRQVQYAQVFLLKPAPFCMLFAGLSTNKSATSLLFLSDSRFIPTPLSSPPSFLLSQTLWQIWQELSSLSSCSIRVQWIPNLCFSWGTTQLIRRGALLVLSTIPCSLSPLVSRMQTSLFSDPHSLATLCLFTTSGPSLVELLAFWGFMVFSHAPIPRKGRETTTTAQNVSLNNGTTIEI